MTTTNEKKAVVLIGMGPGTGAALARRFSDDGHEVAIVARDAGKLDRFEKDIPGTKAFAWDMTDDAAAPALFTDIRGALGPIGTLLYNPAWRGFKTFDESTIDELDMSWGVNARGLFVAAKQVLPDMVAVGAGTIIVSGATASLRGMPSAVTFAPAKAGARMIAQALAREYGPQGVHVAHVVIDGVIDHARMRTLLPDRPDDLFLAPDDIAEAYWMLSQQPRSTWSFEIDLRPFGEKW
jgi:NADP-dependent 3-hydroxy acid dehydrogenase YdfG